MIQESHIIGYDSDDMLIDITTDNGKLYYNLHKRQLMVLKKQMETDDIYYINAIAVYDFMCILCNSIYMTSMQREIISDFMIYYSDDKNKLLQYFCYLYNSYKNKLLNTMNAKIHELDKMM